MTCSDRRTSGRTSAARWPSERAMKITSYSEARLAITWMTRGSMARAFFSSRSSSVTLAASSRLASGSTALYSRRPSPRCATPQSAVLPGARDRAGGVGCRAERVEADVVGIGERGLLARDRAHADALVDVEAAGLDLAFFQAPAFGTRILEIQVGVVDVMREQAAEHRRELVGVEAVRRQQRGLGGMEQLFGGLDGNEGVGGVHGVSCLLGDGLALGH